MTREEIIRNLKYTMEKHKNDTVNTFDTNVSVMCKDILEYLEQEPCEDAISRAKAMTEIMMNTNIREHLDGNLYIKVADAVQILRDLPSVKPQEKTGHWKWVQYDSNPNIGNWHCSECRNIVSDMPTCMGKPLYEFCPNCGCPMEIER